MIANPDNPVVITNAAIAAAYAGQDLEAALMLVDAAKATGYAPGVRIDNANMALLKVGYLHDAIGLLETVVENHPDASKYRRMLVGFLGEAQLNEDAQRHVSRLIRDRQFDLALLLATTEVSMRRFSSKTIDALVDKNPDDLRPQLGRVKAKLEDRDPEAALTLLKQIVDRHPDFAPAQAMLGSVLAATGKTDQLAVWFAGIPEQTKDYSGYWLAVGATELDAGRTAEAVRALGEASRRSSNDIEIWARLAEAVRRLNAEQGEARSESNQIDLEALSASIDQRRTHLLELREKCSAFRRTEPRSQRLAADVAKELLSLGRNWEAEAWLALALQMPDDPSDQITSLRNEAIARLSLDRDWQSRADHPELAFELSRFPLPQAISGADPAIAASGTGKPTAVTPAPLAIRLSEESEPRKLHFYGRVGSGVRGPKVPIHQTLGCGGGVIDFDNDGLHDLAFAAAGGSLRAQDSDPGALFRNLGSTFVDVSGHAQFADPGFSHGISVSDYNDDGFQDIAVMNFGRNRLLRNNGDGTFSDVSEELGEAGLGDWSTSAGIADIDGDGFNDIVIVNYCQADQPFEEPCFNSAGQPINCFPQRYPAGIDRFLRGQPDGSFRDVTSQWAEQPLAGRGLGIVIGRLDGRGQCVYVANDASINHFYRWQPAVDPSNPIGGLVDIGVSCGLAVDAQSLDQGSMGIASTDFDLDGDLDFYVTGFHREYNIFYEQTAPGFWTDRTASMDMVSNTLSLVGFGTEAIDLDSDGVDELLVSNGHIGDFGSESNPYAQPMQLFRRAEQGGFQLETIDSWGDYFATPHIGRALFSCDINHDGRTDAVVTHSTEPVALLVNRSDPTYHRIGFRLVGTGQTRDPVGAVVQFQVQPEGAAAYSRTLYRLGGDGYLCSNQSELRSGTGTSTIVRDVVVSWPDGGQQQLGDLESDAEYLIVQGESPYRLRDYRNAEE